MSIEAKLVVLSKNATKGEVKLKLPLTVGRDKKAGICIAHPMVSRIHCTLFEENGQLAVSDFSSANGTFVNDQKVQHAVVPPGSRIKIGPLEFVAIYNMQSQGRSPASSGAHGGGGYGGLDDLTTSQLDRFVGGAVDEEGDDNDGNVNHGEDLTDSVLLEGFSTGTDATVVSGNEWPLAGSEHAPKEQFAPGTGQVNFNDFFNQFTEDDSFMRDSHDQ